MFFQAVACLLFFQAVARDVSITLDSSWKSSALQPIYETSEFLSSINASSFWRFIEKTIEKDIHVNDVDLFVKEIASGIVSPLILKLLTANLEYRSFAPAIEANKQVSLAHENGNCVGKDTWISFISAMDGTLLMNVCDDIKDIDNAIALVKVYNQGKSTLEKGVINSWDHIYPSSSQSNILAVLYASFSDVKHFSLFHNKLKEIQDITYVLRLRNTETIIDTKLGGFGVYLHIKNMEYKALDDREVKGEEDDILQVDKDESEGDSKLSDKLDEKDPLMALRRSTVPIDKVQNDNLKVSELKYIGLATVLTIALSGKGDESQLDTLRYVSCNFPHVASVVSKKAKRNKRKINLLAAEVAETSQHFGEGSSVIFINGVTVFDSNSDKGGPPFSFFDLLENIKHEILMYNELQNENIKEANTKYSALIGLSDPTKNLRLDIRSGSKDSIFFLNNIEKDTIYKSWGRDLRVILTPSWQLPQIRKNIYTFVFICDITTSQGRLALATVFKYLEYGVPIRFGVVFITSGLSNLYNEFESEPSPARSAFIESLEGDDLVTFSLIRLLDLAEKKYAYKGALEFLKEVASVEMYKPLNTDTLIDCYSKRMTAISGSWSSSKIKEDALSSLKTITAENENSLWENIQFVASRRLNPTGCYLLNGKLIDGLDFNQQSLFSNLFQELRVIQQFVTEGKVTISSNFLKVMTENSLPFYNANILRATTLKDFVSMGSKHIGLLNSFLYSPSMTPEDFAIFTYIILADFGESSGCQIAIAATQYLLKNNGNNGRISLLHLAETEGFSNNDNRGKITEIMINIVLASKESNEVKGNFVVNLLSESKKSALHQGILSYDSILNEAKGLSSETILKVKDAVEDIIINSKDVKRGQGKSYSSTMLVESLQLSGSSFYIIANGRVFKDADVTCESDFSLIEKVIEPLAVSVKKQFISEDLSSKEISDKIFITASILSSHSVKSRLNIPSNIMKADSISTLRRVPYNATAPVQVMAVLNPLSDYAQRWSEVFISLNKLFQSDISFTIKLNPYTNISKFPLERFYKWVDNGEKGAIFNQLPLSQVLTMGVDVPEAWNVQVMETSHDLDNLLLGKDSNKLIPIKYLLKNLIVAGQCLDNTLSEMAPPNGLQLELYSSNVKKADTLVMQNLGYFQLQASPGQWSLRLAQGRASDLFNLIHNTNAVKNVPIEVRDFTSAWSNIFVKKKEGRESESLLDGNDWGGTNVDVKGNDGFFSSVSSFLGVKGKNEIVRPSNDTIHVFSLASGHLYERFMKIMMVSVRKRTSGPIKFWLVENFLSPSFKAFIPKLAVQHNFEVELITYKWPSWLRQQAVKQRIIWGYKILFLDVLFPLNVPKVIYVDADQVVRADLRELWDMDLKGMPYAYTPFCDSNKDTYGFQFWRQGYWANHLKGKPYHISALYVVDLKVFRKHAAGDALRATYDQLSRDENSLSNLDQDLPNYAQHQIPIFSLPQEWLWCESWCSNESKASSKTIDLCNNPQHKEPKLDMAKRIISGDLFHESWIELDNMISALETEGTNKK